MGITIAIVFHNAEEFLLNSIKSVFAQTYHDWELLLIDDGSTDNSLQIALSISDTRVKCFSDGKKLNLAARLNQVIKYAKYDYIARMDADDLMDITRIEKQLSILINNQNIDLVSSGLLSIGKNYEIYGYRIPQVDSIDFDILLQSNPIVHASIVARKSWYERNFYNENLSVAQDYYLWLSASQKNDLKISFIKEPLYYYTESQNINLSKLLRAGITERKIIKDFHTKNKAYKLIISHIKDLITFAMFLLHVEKVFLYKRNRSKPDSNIIKSYQNNLNLIFTCNIVQHD